ncbi:DUF1345 domain-containing protein [Sphingomonas daechungensis]|uniref:DUF1345 domain-containing protein n=1 Tax=Sphingomonas daechungensis TaxID=1176646 RepID=UPI003783DB4F
MSKFAPARFTAFVVLLIAGCALMTWLWHPLKGIMSGFDIAALVFLVSCVPLLNDDSGQMRKQSKENDVNRGLLLGISVTVTTVILVAVGAVIAGSEAAKVLDVALIVATLVIAWLFGNMVYAFHYAHMYYLPNEKGRGDAGGIKFPDMKEPDYWDFVYFAFTLGMTFQTSDCDINSPAIRRVVVGHCMAAFVFNLGVLAFTINALGS